ncbi:MAG: hypothetical protein KDA85_13470, partial [Planctomycetaceae bacterium]|nr:hypothetical protein [Planctomycetaceae bacterium]
VARRQVFAGTVPKRSIGRMVANSLWMVAVLLCVINLPADDTSPIHENHRSIRTAAINVATQCVRAARGESNPPTTLLPSGSVIKPSGADADLTVPRLAQAEAAWQELKFNPAEETIVVYAMAEPALLLHLRELGLHVAPVADVSFSKSTIDGHPVPTFLVFGPNARATPDFLRSWVDGSARRFQTVGRSGYFPGRVVLLNLYSPSTAFEQLYQPFEIFRLQE